MKEQILARLMAAYPGYLSGSQLADDLGVSRVAIWKHIEGLKEEGHDITGISGQGYRLQNIEQVIQPGLIEQNLSSHRFGKPLYYSSHTTSTNLWAKQLLATQQLPEGSLFLAASQSNGRGRLGRSWESPRGGLWFSLVLRPTVNLQKAALLSLVFAVALAQSLEQYIKHPCKIKWPNDLIIDGHKAGGILLEASGEMDAPDFVVAGFGINVNIQEFPEPIQQLATSLALITGELYDLNQLLAHLVLGLEEAYDLFLKEGMGPFLKLYKSRCIHMNQPIAINLGKHQVVGIHRDIDDNGNLIIEEDGQLVRVSAGDVHLLDHQEE